MSMIYDPVTKEFRPRLTSEAESPALVETHDRMEQQTTASTFERTQIRRRQQIRRRHLKQDVLFWIVLLIVALLLAFAIYEVNQRLAKEYRNAPAPSPANPLKSFEVDPAKSAPR